MITIASYEKNKSGSGYICHFFVGSSDMEMDEAIKEFEIVSKENFSVSPETLSVPINLGIPQRESTITILSKNGAETYYKNDKSKTTIFDINVNTPLKVGLTNDLTIFVESENPYLNITNIEGEVVDGSALYPKKKRWNLSLHGGIGVHYGLFGQKVDVGPYVGAGISYNF